MSANSYYSGAPHDGNDGPNGERGVMGALAGGAAGAYGGHEIGGKYTGHTKTSTVIGAVAGAIAGHKLQGAVSDWRDDRKEEHRYENEHHNDHHHNEHHEYHEHHEQHHDRSIGGGGNYSQSSRDAFVESHGDFNLIAECRGRDGGFHRSVLSLNRYLSNEGGNFRWFNGGGGGGPTMTIQPGDTLGSVAARFNCNFDELARMNNIQNPDLIYPGQVLHIPGGGGGSGGNFGGSARDARLVDGGRVLEAELRRPDGSWAHSRINLDERIGNDNGCLRFI